MILLFGDIFRPGKLPPIKVRTILFGPNVYIWGVFRKLQIGRKVVKNYGVNPFTFWWHFSTWKITSHFTLKFFKQGQNYICLSTCLSVFLSIFLYLPVCLPACLSVYLSIYLYIYIYIYVWWKVCSQAFISENFWAPQRESNPCLPIAGTAIYIYMYMHIMEVMPIK